MIAIIIVGLFLLIGTLLSIFGKKQPLIKYSGWGCIGVGFFVLLINSYTTVSSGHVKVASLFGKVQDIPLNEGLHFPVNPMLSFKEIDGRQKHIQNKQVHHLKINLSL